MFTRIKTDQEIKAMRESGRMLATVLELLRGRAESGMSTQDLADIARKELQSLGGAPTFLGMYGFRDVLCVSVNDEVVHGVPPSRKIIQGGDIVSMDFGVTYQGMITDSAISIIVGESDNRTQELVRETEQSLLSGIAMLRAGVKVGDLAATIQQVLETHNLGIVRDLVGHGVGHELHEEPNIPNYGRKGTGTQLVAGMTIAIEPMATTGGHKVVTDPDGWTIRTADQSVAAHFEHTVLVTDSSAEILTSLKTT